MAGATNKPNQSHIVNDNSHNFGWLGVVFTRVWPAGFALGVGACRIARTPTLRCLQNRPHPHTFVASSIRAGFPYRLGCFLTRAHAHGGNRPYRYGLGRGRDSLTSGDTKLHILVRLISATFSSLLGRILSRGSGAGGKRPNRYGFQAGISVTGTG